MRGFKGVAFAFLVFAAGAAQPALAGGTPAPKGAEAYIIQPKDGAVVKSPVLVIFGLRGMGVAPAGVKVKKTGHHHLIIDAPLPDLHKMIPMTNHYIHFSGGETEALIQFQPGKHTLQLLMGDAHHMATTPPVMSPVIHITVVE